MATIMSTPPRRPRCPASVTLTSYQVGSPWMFEGKMLRGETGIPMRRKLLAKSSFAEAEPEPFTLASLMTKSLVASILFISGGFLFLDGDHLLAGVAGAAAVAGGRHLEEELLHVPGARGAA